MKYVILKANQTKLGVVRAYPFIFPEYCTHSEVAKNMTHMIGMETGYIPEVLSAGFGYCGALGFNVTEHGSESLKINKDKMRGEEDQRIFDMPDAMNGVIS